MKAAELKLHLLINGLAIDFESIEGARFKSDKYLHNDRHFAPKSRKMAIPQELILTDDSGHDLCVGVLSRPESSFSLRCGAGGPFIAHKGEPVSIPVHFVPEPVFWTMETPDGIPNYRILSVPGLNELNLWPWHDCSLHYERKGCAFCTTTSTANLFGTGARSNLMTALTIQRSQSPVRHMSDYYPVLRSRSISALSDALQWDFGSQDYWFTLISGNLSQPLLSLQYQVFATLFSDLIQGVPSLNPDHIVANIMAPDSLEDVELLDSVGVSHLMSNLEIWDPDVFKIICPGKAEYGRDRFLSMLEQAAGVLGKGKTWCNFVCGLEPLKTQLRGYEYLARLGIVAGANVFHRDPMVKVDFVDEVSFDTLAEYYRQAAAILRSHGLEPFYCMSSRRSSLVWEAYLGLL